MAAFIRFQGHKSKVPEAQGHAGVVGLIARPDVPSDHRTAGLRTALPGDSMIIGSSLARRWLLSSRANRPLVAKVLPTALLARSRSVLDGWRHRRLLATLSGMRPRLNARSWPERSIARRFAWSPRAPWPAPGSSSSGSAETRIGSTGLPARPWPARAAARGQKPP